MNLSDFSLSADAAHSDPTTWLLIKMCIILLGVALFGWILIKLVVPRLHRMPILGRGRMFSVQGRFDLEPKRTLWIVKVEDRRFLIGATDHSLAQIAELTTTPASKPASDVAEEEPV